jgi:hypothetical protein
MVYAVARATRDTSFLSLHLKLSRRTNLTRELKAKNGSSGRVPWDLERWGFKNQVWWEDGKYRVGNVDSE